MVAHGPSNGKPPRQNTDLGPFLNGKKQGFENRSRLFVKINMPRVGLEPTTSRLVIYPLCLDQFIPDMTMQI